MAGRFEGLSDLTWRLFEDIFPPAVATSTSRGPSPSHGSTSTMVPGVRSSAHVAASVGRHFPVSRGRSGGLG